MKVIDISQYNGDVDFRQVRASGRGSGDAAVKLGALR